MPDPNRPLTTPSWTCLTLMGVFLTIGEQLVDQPGKVLGWLL
jgi:hypothetical protein